MQLKKHTYSVIKSLTSTLLLLVFGISLSAQSQTASESSVPIVDSKFKKVVDDALSFEVDTISVQVLQNLNSKYVLLDAREEEEYNISHIENALYFGYEDPDFSVLKNVEANTPVIIYCSIGYRSEKMGMKLEKMGFTNVKNVYGSIFEWANRGFPLVDGQNNITNVVHGYDKHWSKCVTNPSLEVTY